MKQASHMFRSALLTVATAATLSLTTVTAWAEDADSYPSKAVEFIVQSSAGSSSDVFARQLAKSMEPILGQPVAVLLKPGGGGANQMAYIKSAKADGYTFGVNTLTHFTNMQGTLKGTFGPEDFTWIATVQQEPHVLVVRSDSPYNTFAELDKAISGSEDAIKVGGYGPAGSTANIAMTLAMKPTDIKADWVGFNSSSEAVPALLGGHIDMVVMTPSNVVEFVKAGRMKVLGLSADERSPVLPDVPTLTEQGYQDNTSWQQIRAVYGPAGIPDDIKNKLASAIIEAAQSPEFSAYLDSTGIGLNLRDPAKYDEYVDQLMNVAAEGMQAAGL